MQYVSSKLLIFALGLTLAGSACKSAVYDNAPSAIASASPAPAGTITTTSVINGAITPEKLSQAYLPLAGGTLTGTLTLAGAPTGANDAATKEYVDNAVAAGSGGAVTTSALNTAVASSTATAIASAVATSSPPGTVSAWAGTSAPSGWLLCDGTAVSRTTYASLFAAIGVAHGYGDNSTTFNVPDYRGRFLRGTDNMGSGAASRDPNSATRTTMNTGGNTGNTVGSVQTDALQGHAHGAIRWGGSVFGGTGSTDGNEISISGGNGSDNHTGPPVANGGYGTPRLTTETRPINAYVNYIIKY